MIRIAGATFSFGDLTLEQAAPVVADLGFDRVDVGAGWSNYHTVRPLEAIADPQGQADRVRRVTEAHGLALCELFVMQFEHPLTHPDPAVRAQTQARFEGIARFAAMAGFASAMMIPGAAGAGDSPAQAFDRSAAALRPMVEAAQALGLQCNIEPCAGSVAHHPDDAIRLVQAVPGLGLTVDYAHQVQLGLDADRIEALHPYARHFHAKQSAPGAFQARADEGVVDFARLIRRLHADGWEGDVCVEFVTKQELLDAGWDFRRETARLKAILDAALEAL